MPEMEDGKRTERSPKQGLSGADFAGVGMQFALTIVVFLFAGYWLDKRLGSNGLLTVAFVFIGAAGAFYNMYRKISAAQKQDDAERAARRQGNGDGRPPGQ
jgi:F0F1-type ATP synthase assembly protein I